MIRHILSARFRYLALGFVLLTSHVAYADQRTTSAALMADAVTRNPVTEQMIATGNVTLENEEYRIRADRAEYFEQERLIVFRGNVTVDSVGSRITTEQIEYSLDSGLGEATNAQIVHDDTYRFSATSLRRTGALSYQLESGTFTTCAGDCPDWQFRAGQAEVTQGRYLVARDVTFRIRNVPVWYFPYLVYPVKNQREAGILIPAFTSSSNNGTGLEMTYFHPFGDARDISIFANVYTRTGVMLGGEYRQADDGLGALALNHRFIQESKTKSDDPHRYRTYGEYQLRRDAWMVDGRYDAASDRDFARDYNDESGPEWLRDAGRSETLASVGYQGEAWSAFVRGQSQQTWIHEATQHRDNRLTTAPYGAAFLERWGSDWQLSGSLDAGSYRLRESTLPFTTDGNRLRYSSRQSEYDAIDFSRATLTLHRPLATRYWGMEWQVGLQGETWKPQDGTTLTALNEKPLWRAEGDETISYLLPFVQVRWNSARLYADHGWARHSIGLEFDADYRQDSSVTAAQPLFDTLLAQHEHRFTPRLVNRLNGTNWYAEHHIGQPFSPTEFGNDNSGEILNGIVLGIGRFRVDWHSLYDPNQKEVTRQSIGTSWELLQGVRLGAAHTYERDDVSNGTLDLRITRGEWEVILGTEMTAEENSVKRAFSEMTPRRKHVEVIHHADCWQMRVGVAEDRTPAIEVDRTVYVKFTLAG